MKIIYLLLTLLLPCYIIAQVTGTVLSASTHEPLQGATVLLKGQKQNVLTSNAGKFSITASPGDELLISHAGYLTQSKKIGDHTSLTILLEDSAITLEEVKISNGYQEVPKERSTGSFAFVDRKLFNQQAGTNVLDRLEAITSSLSVDRKSTTGGIMIRGLSTIKGVRSPLIIVDNFPYAGDINNINPNDVESITVLKDAAATSIWGARAGNGVIVITTKKGKFNQALTIDVNSNVTFTDAPDLFYQKLISSNDFIDVEQFLFSKGFKFSDTAVSTKPAFTPVYEILFKQRKGLISAADATAQVNALRNFDVRNDFLKYMYREAVNQQYALSVRGGSASVAWLLSAGVDRNLSNLSANYNRYNARMENIFRVSKKLQLTTGITYTQSNTRNGRPGYGSITAKSGAMYPYAQFADALGNPIPMTKDYRQTYIDTAGAGKLLDWKYYPLDDYNHVSITSTLNDVLLKAGLNYKIITGLQLDVKYQYERQSTDGNNLQDAGSYFARDLVNRFSQLNRNTGVVTYKIPKGGVMDVSNSAVASHNLRGQVNYNGTWGKHSIAIIAGGELSSAKTASHSSRSYGYNSDILTTAAVDLANSYPSFVNGSNTFIPDNSGFGEKLNRTVSFYSNAAYTFNERYTFSLSGRKDASNILGINTNYRWKPLWSTGTGWELSKENFYKSKMLPYLKLRATLGYSGNIDPSKTALTTFTYSGASPYTLTPYAIINNFYNPDLRWEKVRMINIGADFRTAGDRISGSIEAYEKKATDLFGTSPIDYTLGLGVDAITKNVASMKGHGIDIEINTLNIDRKIKWRTVIDLSFYRDKVLSYYATSNKGSNYISTGEALTAVEGKPVYSVFSYRWGGLDSLTGDPRGFVNGQLSKDYTTLTGSGTLVSDLIYNGPQFPFLFGFIGNTITWKNISLTGRILYRFGYYFRRQSIDYTNLFSSWNGSADYPSRWQKPGDELNTNVPSLVYPAVSNRDVFYLGSEVNVLRADNIRLQYVNLTYEIKRMHARAYVIANNIGILWRANKYHLDPDYRNTDIPPSKSFTIGINASF